MGTGKLSDDKASGALGDFRYASVPLTFPVLPSVVRTGGLLHIENPSVFTLDLRQRDVIAARLQAQQDC